MRANGAYGRLSVEIRMITVYETHRSKGFGKEFPVPVLLSSTIQFRVKSDPCYFSFFSYPKFVPRGVCY
jgi:hypothetical protein